MSNCLLERTCENVIHFLSLPLAFFSYFTGYIVFSFRGKLQRQQQNNHQFSNASAKKGRDCDVGRHWQQAHQNPRSGSDMVSQHLHRTQQAGFANELVKQTLGLDEGLGSIEFLDLSLVEYDNTVAVEDRIDAVRNCGGHVLVIISPLMVTGNVWGVGVRVLRHTHL